MVKSIKDKYKEKIDYNQKYSLSSYIMLFFTFSFIGWIWEIILNLITNGTLVNKGTLYGPWLPIYGFGSIIFLILLKPLRNKPLMLFLSCIVLSGILEYSTSWYLETFHHMKWWDYSSFYFNINGRICLEALVLFAIGGTLIIYILAPILNKIYLKINPHILKIICTILVTIFLVDAAYSFFHPNSSAGITIESRQKL